MKKIIIYLSLAVAITSCNRHVANQSASVCDVQKAYSDNKKKLSIKAGVWGTVSLMEGNCMPSIGGPSTSCKNCPVQRVVKIYHYTTTANTKPINQQGMFYDAFSTELVAEVTTDDNGFFQAEIPGGKYTVVVVENGKLYASLSDGDGGLNPVEFSTGVHQINVVMTYNAAM